MKSKFVSENTAKRLMVGGVIGFITGIVLSIVLFLPIFSKVGDCTTSANTCTKNITVEQIEGKLLLVLMYASLAAIVAGVVMMITISVKGKQRDDSTSVSPSANSNNAKRLLIKTLALVGAFFAGSSLVSLIVVNLVPVLFSSKNTDEQRLIFASLIIILNPLAGALAVYMTNKWLKTKLK